MDASKATSFANTHDAVRYRHTTSVDGQPNQPLMASTVEVRRL
jgi:hypothetical protein